VDAEQQALHGAPGEVGADETERQIEQDALADDKSDDAVPGGAKSQSHARWATENAITP
jgi:hypothetical protein